MVRSISTAALAKLGTNLGTEPQIIIDIQWVDGGQRNSYADKAIESANIPGKIIDLGALDDVSDITGSTQSQSITITLDDTDGSIKAIFDSNDIHKRPCWIYQWFVGLDLTDRFLIFNGLISTPIEWDEGARTVKFDVISQIESIEVGFSVEEGNFPNPPYQLIGQAWPMGFGTVLDGPALFIDTPLQGILALGSGIADPISYGISIAQAQQDRINCPLMDCGLIFTQVSPNQNGGGNFYTNYCQDPNCLHQTNTQLLLVEDVYAQQQSYETPTLTIYGGENFPQHTALAISINGSTLTGSFNGQIFTITSRQGPPSREVNWRGGYSYGTTYLPYDAVSYGTRSYICVTESLDNTPADATYWSVISLNNSFQGSLGTGFVWLAPGSPVYLASDVNRPYVVNIIPSTVLRVAAYRNISAGRQLVDVPSQYYSVQTTNYGTFEATEIIMNVQLSTLVNPTAVVLNPVTDVYIPGESAGWEDDLYISYTSSVGPNPVDIMQWLVTTYTQFTVDSDSFSYVRTKLANYPCNFQMSERKDVQQVLQDIAYQSRCALYLKDSVVFVKYLSEEPTPVDSIGMSDIVANTLKITHTVTEDLITQYEATWLSDYQYSSNGPDYMILRRNVSKYNIQRFSYNYYALTDESLVRKTATYWLIKRSGIWRLAEFSTPLQKLNLEVYDAVTLNLPSLAPTGITGIVQQAKYNSDTNQIDFVVWTPLLSGTTTPYHFAWPADVSEQDLFPLIIEREEGLAGNFNSPNFLSAPPRDSRLAIAGNQVQFQNNFEGCVEWTGGPPCRSDFGDQFPSDTGDTAPTKQVPGCISIGNPNCGNGTGPNGDPNGPSSGGGCCQQVSTLASQVSNQAAQITALQTQATATQQELAALAAAGGIPQDGAQQAAKLSKLPKSTIGCQVKVSVQNITPTEVALQHPDAQGHVRSDAGGAQGRAALSNPGANQVFTFNSLAAANQYATSLRQSITDRFNNWQETVGASQPEAVNVLGWSGGSVGKPCQEPAAPALVAYNPSS